MRNFFATLSDIEKSIVKGGWTYSVFNQLTGFIESGTFTQSSMSKYICMNWRLTSREIWNKWNAEQVEEKQYTTWRSQVSTLSRQLYALFPQVETAFIEGDSSAVQQIANTIALIKDGDECFNDIFISELRNMSLGYSGREYPLEECSEEIKLLQRMTRRNIYDDIDCLNEDKLGYLQKVLNTPLVSARYRTVNLKKVEVLNRLLDYRGVSEEVKSETNNKYGFASIGRISEILEEKAERGRNKVTGTEELQEQYAKKAVSILRLFTEEHLLKLLDTIPDEQFYIVWKNTIEQY